MSAAGLANDRAGVSAIGTKKTAAEEDTAQLHLKIDAGGQKNVKSVLDRLEGSDGILGHVMNGSQLKVIYKPTAWGARALLKTIQVESKSKIEVDPTAGIQRIGKPDPTIKRDLFRCIPPLSLIVFTLWVLGHTPYASIAKMVIMPGLNAQTLLLIVCALPIIFVMGGRFHSAALKAVKSGVTDMNVLISISTLMTFGYSLLVSLFSILAPYIMGFPHSANPPPAYFEAPCMIITFLLVGKTLEANAKQSTAESLNELLGSQPVTANLLQSGTKAEPVPIELVQIDDRLQVFPGDAAPVDGIMMSDGEASFDESLLTGESKMIKKKKGDFIIGGSRCLSGRVELQVQRVGSGTMLNQIASLVEKAQTSRAPVQTVADSIAKYFIPSVMCLAFATWTVWYVLVIVKQVIPLSQIQPNGTDWPMLEKYLYVLEFGLTVLLVACPCALGLATPTAVMTATGVAAKFGILLKSGGVPLELGSKITHIVLDKTGTITEGKPKVHKVAAFQAGEGGVTTEAWGKLRAAHLQAVSGQPPLAPKGTSNVEMTWLKSDSGSKMLESTSKAEYMASFWWAVGCAEISSEHPLAKVLVDVARVEAGCELVAPSNFENIKGKGVRCSLDGMQMLVGSVKSIFEESGNGVGTLKAELEEWVGKCRLDGSTVIAVAIDGIPLGAVALRDQISPFAKECISGIQMSGTEVWMCTGDHAASAQAIAKEVGIQPWKIVAEALPADKVTTVEKLQQEFKDRKNIVAMVGDGINDSPALAAADIGVAIGAGHNVTVDAADVVLVRSDLKDLVTYLQLSKEAIAVIWRNFMWAFFFNMAAIPIAAGCFIPWGLKMSPYIAVGAMSISSLLVVNSSLNLRNFEPKHRD